MREYRLIREAIKSFELNLNGYTVLTEAATGNYVWTPIIAALAGAKVFAFSKDSRYGTFSKVKDKTEQHARELGVFEKIHVIDQLDKEVIHPADIITNTGFLRPLNKEKLQYCKETVVIPLMYEAWEFRESDIDLAYCKQKKIPVFGTNESDPRLLTISYLGAVAKKALFLKGIEVFKSKIAVLGYGHFAEAIFNSLKLEADLVEMWNKPGEVKHLDQLDAIVIADHQTDTLYLGKNGILSPEKIREENPDLIIIHVSGNVDEVGLEKYGLNVFPEKIAPPKWMSLTTDFAGPKPVIDLHTAGLKVGEGMSKTLKLALKEEAFLKVMLENYSVTTL